MNWWWAEVGLVAFLLAFLAYRVWDTRRKDRRAERQNERIEREKDDSRGL